MKILQVTAGSASTILLVVLMVGSAGAAPSLNLGANANYALNVSMQSTQSCNATPSTYNQTACGPFQQRALVSIYDDGSCLLNNSSCFFSPVYNYCYYSPPLYNTCALPLGITVMWFNYGSLTHSVTWTNNPGGVPNSPLMAHFGSFSATFNTVGNYTYHDPTYPSMRGNILVSTTPLPPPVSSSFNPAISLTGTFGWTVDGLDSSVAVLNVSHQVSIVASQGAVTFTPVTETGSFSQSIDLATRVESSGTTTALLLGLIQKALSSSPGYYGYYGYPSALGQMLSTDKPVHTFWWVNGPLSNGSPVQILTGYSSVAGSEMVNLGPGNNRNAWIVDSMLSESVSTTFPPVISQGGSSLSSFRLDLRFDYDQLSDLLLRSSASVEISSSQMQVYAPGQDLCGPSGCFPVSDTVTVTHHMSSSAQISLQLTTTTLDLSKRMAGLSGSGQSSGSGPAGGSGTLTLPPAMTMWIYAGIGVAGAVVLVTVAWLLRRRGKIGAPVAQPGPMPVQGPPLTPPKP